MSLPEFDLQGSLFESLASMGADLFEDSDRYKLLATKIWPLLAQSREELAECYTEDNGRPGIEPVVLLGVLIFQFLERVPEGTEIGQGRQVVLLREIFAQQYVVKQGAEIDPVKVHATGGGAKSPRSRCAVVSQRSRQAEKGVGWLQSAGG